MTEVCIRKEPGMLKCDFRAKTPPLVKALIFIYGEMSHD